MGMVMHLDGDGDAFGWTSSDGKGEGRTGAALFNC